MTKSQNTKNEQQKDLCITSEQLTDGYHYAIVFDKERIIEKKKDLPIPYCEGFCCHNYQYLAPVPSYEEYEQLENWNRFTADYHALREAKEIAEYEKGELLEKVKQLKDKIERLEKQYDHAKWWLNEIVKNHRFTPISTAEKALKDLSELENV